MGFFNERVVSSLFGGEHTCVKCRGIMEFEDEWEDTLICTKCGYTIDSDRYGFENDEDYDALYPTEEEVLRREKDGNE